MEVGLGRGQVHARLGLAAGLGLGGQQQRAAGAHLADNNTELSAQMTQQVTALEQSASAMEELSAVVQQNPENTHQADAVVERTAQAASQVATWGHGTL